MIKEIKHRRKYSKLLNILSNCTSAYITDSTYYFYVIDGFKQFLFYVQDDGEIVFYGHYNQGFTTYSDLFGFDIGLTNKEVKDFIYEKYSKRN